MKDESYRGHTIQQDTSLKSYDTHRLLLVRYWLWVYVRVRRFVTGFWNILSQRRDIKKFFQMFFTNEFMIIDSEKFSKTDRLIDDGYISATR